jgi:hypothetical protein
MSTVWSVTEADGTKSGFDNSRIRFEEGVLILEDSQGKIDYAYAPGSWLDVERVSNADD